MMFKLQKSEAGRTHYKGSKHIQRRAEFTALNCHRHSAKILSSSRRWMRTPLLPACPSSEFPSLQIPAPEPLLSAPACTIFAPQPPPALRNTTAPHPPPPAPPTAPQPLSLLP